MGRSDKTGDPELTEIVTSSLEFSGYQVVSAPTGTEAIAACDSVGMTT